MADSLLLTAGRPAAVSAGWADLDRGLFPISVAAELARLRELAGEPPVARPAWRPRPGGSSGQ